VRFRHTVRKQDLPPAALDVLQAFEGRPVMERLQFLKEILCNRAHATEPPDATLLMAMGMLFDVTDELQEYPELAEQPGSTSLRRAPTSEPG
jgi:hypothetical protein